MEIKQIGEFGLIEDITRDCTFSAGVIKGVGDDAAVLEFSPAKKLLVTTDMLVENVHFLWDRITPFQLGYKSMAVNLSDIAAMGGIPRYAVTSIALRQDISVREIREIYDGMKAICARFGVNIVGGDTVSSDKLVINVTLFGEGQKERIFLRSGARAGDLIVVTNTLGDSAAGLELILDSGIELDKISKDHLLTSHLQPLPRLQEAEILRELGYVTSMIDISDGLSSEINHICRNSKVGAIIWQDKIPISDATIKLSKNTKKTPFDYALNGGEDYELLFTIPAAKKDDFMKNFVEKCNTKATFIGEITTENDILLLTKSNERLPISSQGYNHFKR